MVHYRKSKTTHVLYMDMDVLSRLIEYAKKYKLLTVE